MIFASSESSSQRKRFQPFQAFPFPSSLQHPLRSLNPRSSSSLFIKLLFPCEVMTFIRFFFLLCVMRWESSQLNSTLKISLVSPLSRFAQRFLHKKNSLHNIMAEQGPKVGDARSLWNFTPSPGILLCACSFFLSLFVYCARLCRDDDDDDDVLVLGTFVSRV